MRHNVRPDEEEQPDGAEDLECESLSSKEIRELQDQQKKKQPSPPKRKLTPIGGRKEKAPQEDERLAAPRRQGPFDVITDALQEI